ncbi:MAG: hypothetical protein ACOC56_01890 [Atribacterota bacterium]
MISKKLSETKTFDYFLVAFIISVILVIVFFIYSGMNSLFFGKDFLRPSCHTETNYFIKEEIKKTEMCPEGCLYIYSYQLLLNDPHIREEKYRKVYKTYYFKETKELSFNNDININEPFYVRWCYINRIKAERIRGIWKNEN